MSSTHRNDSASNPDALQLRVQIGVRIELYTIPLYLYAMYSVKPQGNGLQARELLKGIAFQEMLHLALSGNLLSALGGQVILYDRSVVPEYTGSTTLLCTAVPVNLEPLSHISLGHFMEIEAPVDGPQAYPWDPSLPMPLIEAPDLCEPEALASRYCSIGQLYEEVILRVRNLGDTAFARNLYNQFVGQDFFGDQLFAIVDQSTALKALRTVIEQGEGSLRTENSHYDVFSKLYSNVNWDVYNVPRNPTTEGYKGNEFVYRVSRSFDAAYCYLLETIQRVWRSDDQLGVNAPTLPLPIPPLIPPPRDISERLVLLRNIHGIMSNVLTPLAGLLVQLIFGKGRAAPCFNYYPVLGSITLHQALVNEVKSAMESAPSNDTIGREANSAAGKVDTMAGNASREANAAAPGSPVAREAAAIYQNIQQVAIELRSARPGDHAAIVTLAGRLAEYADGIARCTQASARASSDVRKALGAVNAATDVSAATEEAFRVARRGNPRVTLEKLRCYIEDHLKPRP